MFGVKPHFRQEGNMNKKIKILVVDDDESVRFVIKAELERKGFEVDIFFDGTDAAKAAKNGNYVVALVDLWMPDSDGVETCKMIKRNSPITDVILMSGNPDGFEGREGDFIKAGGIDFLLYKPFLEGELSEVIFRALKNEGIKFSSSSFSVPDLKA